ncbi:phosphoribosylanthranilate isomerase [Flagellimonas sp.]|uniref:phosphoribosylanthranilate isomerase n=1 Tax=Flagellimonas sp. TaxID=2058762 RepID=UPI003F4A5598
MKLKVCGQKYNVGEVAELQPDYLGFIFWEPSSRFFEGDIPALSEGTKKIGVFVDATVDEVLQKIERYQLEGVQLHGKESPEYCNQLRHSEFVSESHSKKTLKQVQGDNLEIIKVFSIKDEFDFSVLKPYEEVCDYFLFDTKGKLPGGNGYVFNWKILERYPSTKPYFLSGGIGLDNVKAIQSFLRTEASKYCYAIDVNSRFETEPGQKDIKKIKEFKNLLKHELSR